MVLVSFHVRRFTLAFMIASPLAAMAQEDASRAPLAQAGDKYVALDVRGCADRCPSFEIYVFDSGRMIFRPNNQYNSTQGPVRKSGMRSIYERIAKYVQDSGALTAPTDCTNRKDGTSAATVMSSDGSQEQRVTWSAGCENQADQAKNLAKVFVNQTGFTRSINSDPRYWKKHWETWEYPDASKTAAKQ